MQGNQFPSSNENINIQLRLSPLILLSEGLEKEANELYRLERYFFFFFLNRVSKDFFFFFSVPTRPTKERWKRVIRLSCGDRRANPEALLQPAGPGPGASRRGGRLRGVWQGCPRAAPAPRSSSAHLWLSLALPIQLLCSQRSFCFYLYLNILY